MKMHSRLIVIALGSVVLTALSPAPAAATLHDSWQRVQMALAEPSAETLRERVMELKEVAAEVDARRLTPYAETLVAWASEHPDELGETVVKLAQELDPALPSAPFLEARLAWKNGSLFRAFGAYLRAWSCTLKDSITRHNLFSSITIWGLMSLGISLAIVIVLQSIHHFRMVAHDAFELGMVLFQRANAWVFAVVVLTLPFFAGLGPVWLVAYLFALSWPYLPQMQRIAAAVTCFLLVILVPLLEVSQRRALRPIPVSERVVSMLDDRRIDPSTLRDFIELRFSLNQQLAEHEQIDSNYYLLLGELFRMHGDHESARAEFGPNEDTPDVLVCRGNIEAENGNMRGAIQLYNEAIKLDQNSALAYVNLSFALDQDNQFQQATAARQTALKLLPRGTDITTIGVGGFPERIRYPRLGQAEMAKLISAVPPEARQLLGLGRASESTAGLILNPVSAVFVFSGLLGGLALFLRKKWMWTGQACVKCGKIFCPRCKSATESSTYCSQCISVFLKRDEVAMDQQQAKMAQIERWRMLSATGQRIAAILLPGGGLVLTSRLWLGLGLGFAGWLFLVGIIVWAPQFFASIEPNASATPFQVFLGLLFLAVWLLSVTLTWNRR
jgi:tetratricopeptide (TPR) repeat protein